MAACGGAGNSAEPEENVYSKLEAVELIGADSTGVGSAGQLFGQFFAQRVLEITGGKLSVDYHPNGELVGDLGLIRLMKANQIQVVVCQTAPMVSFIPEMAVFDLPMVFSNMMVTGSTPSSTGRMISLPDCPMPMRTRASIFSAFSRTAPIG